MLNKKFLQVITLMGTVLISVGANVAEVRAARSCFTLPPQHNCGEECYDHCARRTDKSGRSKSQSQLIKTQDDWNRLCPRKTKDVISPKKPACACECEGDITGVPFEKK